jgi:hypothetical protein
MKNIVLTVVKANECNENDQVAARIILRCTEILKYKHTWKEMVNTPQHT